MYRFRLRKRSVQLALHYTRSLVRVRSADYEESMIKSRDFGDGSEGTQTSRRLDQAQRKKHETDINQYSCEKLQIARNCAA